MEQQSKGKPVTTSVPSISIKFHANAEQLEELYASDEEQQSNNDPIGPGSSPANTSGIGEPESSPLKYFPRLVKRSTSIDITPTASIDASPPSDPWRFFSDIKGKITKSVEEKITEIKARNQEEGSPLKGKTVKDSKDNSSVSDSEDLSESSISKTCGIVSTTEGAEMSSDEDTPSIEKDKKTDDRTKSGSASSGGGLRHRFRLLKPKSTREGAISRSNLVKLYNINADRIEQALPEESEIESAIDALEETELDQHQQEDDKDVLRGLDEHFDNIRIEGSQVVVVKEVPGNEVKPLHWPTRKPKTVFAPVGFVDMREPVPDVQRGALMPVIIIFVFLVTYFLVHSMSTYLAGIMVGAVVTFLYYHVKLMLDSPVKASHFASKTQNIMEIPAVQECQPLAKHEGWVNEFPDVYNPHTYHISQTQSVFLRLQGNLLRLSHTRSKVPKRALWNEPKIKPIFTHHRVYNLLAAKITLLPDGLAKKRHWSKKYPICVTLNKDQMHFEAPVVNKPAAEEEEEATKSSSMTSVALLEKKPSPQKRTFTFTKKKKYQSLAQRFSKLTEENEEYELDSENSRASTPSPPSADMSEDVDEETRKMLEAALDENLRVTNDECDDDFDALPEDWSSFTPPEESPTETRLYLFGRTDREKEDWFRRLTIATHKGASCIAIPESADMDFSKMSFTLKEEFDIEMEYVKYMMIYKQTSNRKSQKNDLDESMDDVPPVNIQWINAFVGRVLFDCLRDESFTERVKDKIQRKMGSIKLPYFIEELLVTELTLGHTPPLVHRATKPMMDERGLWVDLDVTYEGKITLILQTKLNLMKLKHPHANVIPAFLIGNRTDCSSRNTDRPAMFNSDVEDSAESTSDEEAVELHQQQQAVLDASGLPVQGLGGTSNTSKKFIKMVDKIAESKFFQAATEYRYIKKAMEGVSNTDLRLRVEIKELTGTLVVNIPPPPSDRVWIGFRPIPDLALSAQPIVGERNITFLRIISWIEKKLLQEFQKLLVIPNMEDFIIPVMSPKLPQ